MAQIAYVSEFGQIRLFDLDQGIDHPVSLAAEGDANVVDSWPTWSPDGTRIAYFRYELRGGDVRRASIEVAPTDGSAPIEVYPPSGGAPIYMAWSPDSRRLAVLMQEGSSLLLRLFDARGGRAPATVAQGAPLYYAWLADSSGLVAHVGMERVGAPASRLVWVRLEAGQPSYGAVAQTPADGFRAPSWSTALEAVTVAIEAEKGSTIVALAGESAEPVVLAEAGLSPAFSWSPDGRTLAYTSKREGEPLYSGLWVYRVETATAEQVTDSPALACFWHPDSRRLVYFTGEVANRSLALRIVDTATLDVSDYGWLRPTRDMVQLFSHFDQYVLSSQLFSANGESMVLAASRAKELENGPVPTVREVLVRPIANAQPDRVLAKGRLAFWQP